MKITVQTTINSNIDTVWKAWNSPEDVKKWNAASDDWHTTESTIDLREGGSFTSRMEAKDGSMGFDFTGTYTKIIDKSLIEYSMADGRTVIVKFSPGKSGVYIEETFDAESVHSEEQQRQGWQSILNNFAKHVEAIS